MVDVAELKRILESSPEKEIHISLPDGKTVPSHFHVTEIGSVRKDFIDCGGTQRVSSTCLLQCWVANDVEHRIGAEKLLEILELGAKVLVGDFLPVEVEYETSLVAQYPLEKLEVDDSVIIFRLGNKHTDCLAKEQCGISESEEDC